jgi:adenylylsulfate kinase
MVANRDKAMPGWVIWFVGLPGAGKSTYARAVYQILQGNRVDVKYLEMDERRKAYFPKPKYTKTERAEAYRLFAEEAAEIAHHGQNVILDGTAHRLSMREYMRQLVPRFAEIFIRCSLETAVQRESDRREGKVTADLYKKALIRKRTGAQFEGLGEVIGVDTEFQENPSAECIIDSDQENIEQGRDKVLAFLSRWQERTA